MYTEEAAMVPALRVICTNGAMAAVGIVAVSVLTVVPLIVNTTEVPAVYEKKSSVNLTDCCGLNEEEPATVKSIVDP